jgi:hypothetical protein
MSKPAGNEDPAPDWAYASDSLMDVPDGARIARHADEIIFRALTQGRTVAFVGAGASMAYGRLSWRDLVLTAIERALVRVMALEKRIGELPDQIARAKRLLEKHRPASEAESDSGAFPLLFQLAERLDELVAAAEGQPPKFRRDVIEGVQDDWGQARNMLREVVQERRLLRSENVDSEAQDWISNERSPVVEAPPNSEPAPPPSEPARKLIFQKKEALQEYLRVANDS